MNNLPSNKCKGDFTHRCERMKRLEDNGVFMGGSGPLQESEETLLRDLLMGNRVPAGQDCPFPLENLSIVINRTQHSNKSRIRRDISPWLIPSAELLFFCGELAADYIGEEVNGLWTRCATMGGTQPKPDYTVGLSPSSFTPDEFEKLINYSTPTKPVHVTPGLCFPFLICEVKTGEKGFGEADRQNIHSASIAVRAIIELFKSAFGSASDQVKNLYGQLLVFTVSQSSVAVSLHGHYAVATRDGKGLRFHRYPIDTLTLTKRKESDRFVCYNFVRNLYDNFAPKHRQRIQDATAALPSLSKRTTLSPAASESQMQDEGSQSGAQSLSSQDDADLKMSGLLVSNLHDNEIDKIRAEAKMEARIEMMQEMEQYRIQMEQQMRPQMEQH